MKKRLLRVFALAALLTLLASTHATAQTSWEVGVVGGVNIADIIGDDSGETSKRTGFVGGGLVMAHISETFGIRLEALYTQKGWVEEVFDSLLSPAPVEVKTKLDYVEIPILAVLSRDVSDAAELHAFIGPALAFNISAKIAVEGFPVEIDLKDLDLIKAIDFGGVIGVGASFGTGSVNILLDARWTYGLTSIDDTGSDADVHNSVFSFTGGIAIPIPTE